MRRFGSASAVASDVGPGLRLDPISAVVGTVAG